MPKEVCKEIPREVRIPNDLSNSEGGEKDLFENVFFPGVFGGGAAHMCASEEARVPQRLPRRLQGYLLVQGLRIDVRVFNLTTWTQQDIQSVYLRSYVR